MSELTHLDETGRARMVDVGHKAESAREAVAAGEVTMQPGTLRMIMEGNHKKGDVFAVARIAGIQAAKRCAELIPLCHPLMLNAIDVELKSDPESSRVEIRAICRVNGRTGVEMEALTAASVTALTVYDMCKAVDREMVIGNIRLLEKRGGQSGEWIRE